MQLLLIIKLKKTIKECENNHLYLGRQCYGPQDQDVLGSDAEIIAGWLMLEMC
jgi:hypothetical protein